MNELEELKAYLALREELTNTDFENIHIISTTEGNATLRASTILDLISRLEKAEGEWATLSEALSTVCDERDEAYSEIDDLAKQNNELFEDIEKITSANADLVGWSRAKDERIRELEEALKPFAREAAEWSTKDDQAFVYVRGCDDDECDVALFNVGHLRTASRALGERDE